MAFLDNSGDIILDAVLTDTGRKRMAEGNFRITKFALGDEEIDYSLYDYNDNRGSAYFDIDVLSTPVLEACTDNAAGLKSKLISIPRTDFTFLPVIKLNDKDSGTGLFQDSHFLVAADADTNDRLSTDFANNNKKGILYPSNVNKVQLHQGIDNQEVPHTLKLSEYSADLIESQYIIEIDDRLGAILGPNRINNTRTAATVSYVDDDKMASYFLSLNQAGNYVNVLELNGANDQASSNIAGARGTSLEFSIGPKVDLVANDFLFLKLGGTVTIESVDYYYIDTTVKVMGATTGYRVDIPVRFVKLQS